MTNLIQALKVFAMRRCGILLAALLMLGACRFGGDAKPDPDRAWANCIFELDKVEAVRGRNLDDLDKGLTVARNQFMMDCLWTQHVELTKTQLDDMGNYAASKKDRAPTDVSLNSGKR